MLLLGDLAGNDKAFEIRLAPHVSLVWGEHDDGHQWHGALIFLPINFAEKHPHLKNHLVKESFFLPFCGFEIADAK